MNKKIDIIGAGLSGLISSKVFEHFDVTIYEKNKHLTNNHNAVLRFKTNSVGALINKNFKHVNVYKDIISENGFTKPDIQQNNKYSKKVTDMILERSISDTSNQKRFICDFNLQNYLANASRVKIKYNFDFKIRKSADIDVPLVSTLPMHILMDTLGYKNKPEFKYDRISILTYRIKNCNVYQTIYYTMRNTNLYRATITKDILIIEFMKQHEDTLNFVLRTFGLNQNDVECKLSSTKQEYGKLVPISSVIRKEFIGWATRNFNIYSIGRFATWRNIQLDDVVKDAIKIKNAIDNKGYF